MLEEDENSIGSIHLSEGVSSTATHIRYHSGPYEMCYIENIGVSERSRNWMTEIYLVITKPCSFWRCVEPSKVLKNIFLCGVAVVLIVCIVTVISLIASSHRRSEYIAVPRNWKFQYCLTEKCIHTASYMLSSINNKVNPCDNFYDFACGRWLLSNPIPDGRSIWGRFNQLEQANQLIIKNLLERETFAKEECEAEQKAKRYYLSCLDLNDTTEKLGAKPMLDLLQDIGSWQIIDKQFNITDWNFQNTFEKLKNNYSLGGLFFWIVAENDKNSSEYIIQIDQPGLTLPSTENYKNITNNTKLYNAYLDYMTTVASLLGAEQNSTRETMKDVISFEVELASIIESDEARRDEDKNYHRMTIAELQNIAPFMNWEKFFTDAFHLTNRTITKDQQVVMYATEYLKSLYNLLKGYIGKNYENKLHPSTIQDLATTLKCTLQKPKVKCASGARLGPRVPRCLSTPAMNCVGLCYKILTMDNIVLHNYLAWQAVHTMTSYLSKPFRESYKGLRKVLFGSEGSLENWRYCITDTNNVLGFAIGALYVREAFHGNSKPIARKMINNIRDAFKENFEKLKWMDKYTLPLAKKKADSIVDMIGFPDYILNPNELNEKYVGLEIKDNEYFLNNIRINQFRIKENLMKLDQPVNKSNKTDKKGEEEYGEAIKGITQEMGRIISRVLTNFT
ncbi:hypothetical protein PGB90_007886 [Kerria lacca]